MLIYMIRVSDFRYIAHSLLLMMATGWTVGIKPKTEVYIHAHFTTPGYMNQTVEHSTLSHHSPMNVNVR